ncbi:hypothetical protein TKK_0015250 [Trichogramma kaykai]
MRRLGANHRCDNPTRKCQFASSSDVRLRLLVLATCCLVSLPGSAEGLFEAGKEYVYDYEAVSSTGVLLPSKAQSSWGFAGSLRIRVDSPGDALMRLESLRLQVANGLDELSDDMDAGAPLQGPALNEMAKPFRLQYRHGKLENFSVEASEAVWATNIKRSIAGVLQLDLPNLESQVAFHSTETNHYGRCTMEYVVTIESGEPEKRVIRKSVDPRTCQGHGQRHWTNVPNMPCPNTEQNPVMKASERFYEISTGLNSSLLIRVNATGEIYVQPFQSLGEAHFLITNQRMKLISVLDIAQQAPSVGSSNNTNSSNAETDNLHEKHIQHELPGDDLTQGRGVPDKEAIFKTISALLDRLSQRLETPGLDTEVRNLHNTTISVLLYYMGQLTRPDLRAAYSNISGTSYKEETVRNMFLEALPQVGTTESALFVLELIRSQSVSDITAIQLLTHLPFHVRKPDVQLLLGLQPLLNLNAKIAPEVQHTGILTFGTLVYKTCLKYCPYEMLDDYVKLYLDKFTGSQDYEKKMVWLEGLSNIQLGRVVEFLEPIASGMNAESRHLRVLAAWASLPTAPLRPDVIYPLYWPILVNRTEHLEMRVAALTLLLISNPTANRIASIYWYLKGEPNRHLYHYFYTTLKSMERSHFPCFVRLSGVAAQFSRLLKKPSGHQHILTGNYLFDYKDSRRHFGAVINGIIIANPLTNIPQVAYVTLKNHGSGKDLNHVSLYIKAEGLLHAISTNLNDLSMSTRVEDLLKKFKFNHQSTTPVHVEIVARVQQKAVLCLHLNQSNLVDAFKYISSLQDSTYHVYKNIEFHVNQQNIHVPLTVDAVQVTDLGTNVRIAAMATSLFSMRGNFTHVPNGRNNHFILRTSIHGTESIENYNPLADIWHAGIRSQSIHGYLPVNVTFGLQDKLFVSYMTPEHKLKAGLTAHVKTVTSVRGYKVRDKLRAVCRPGESRHPCPELHTVKRFPDKETTSSSLLELPAPELGGVIGIKVFDCETSRTHNEEQYIADVLGSHQSNSQIWPLLESLLLSLHFFDYLSYVPPMGSCGLEMYIEPLTNRSSEVRFEYAKTDKYHTLALTRRGIGPLQAQTVHQQWNLALAYDVTSWLSDSFKIKATRSAPGEQVFKICLEISRDTPWDWDFLSVKPSEPASLKANLLWGMAEQAKGKCAGSSLTLDLVGEVTSDQIEESRNDVWPYNECRRQSANKTFVPYTVACYEASREMSTLKKYKITITHENLPTLILKAERKLRALLELLGSSYYRPSSSSAGGISGTDKGLSIAVTFAKDLHSGPQLYVNGDRVYSQFNSDTVNNFLIRSRLHKYMDSVFLQSFFSTCVLNPSSIRSSSNATHAFAKNSEKLVLARCDDNNPRFALRATNKGDFVELSFDDEADRIILSSNGETAVIQNYSNPVPLTRNFEFSYIGSKWARMDKQVVDLVVAEILLFVHWSREQVLLFYPNYIQEFVCGYCTLQDANVSDLYERF